MSFHHQQAVPSHHSDVVASFRSHPIGSKSFKHSIVIFIALKRYRRSIVSPSFQCPPTPASSFHRPEVEFVVASSGSHSGVSLSSHVIPFVRRSTVREAFPRHPRFLILGSSEEEHLSRPRPDRFGPIHDRSFRSPGISDPFPGHSDIRTVQPTDSRPFADNAISDRFPKPTRRPRSVGLELRRHPGVTPSSRSFPSLRCRSIISQSF